MKHTTYIQRLLQEMEGCRWNVEGIVEVEQVEKYGKAGVRVKGEPRIYDKQRDIYIWQGTGYMVDDYYGWMLFPFSGKKYLQVSYEC